MQIEEDVALAPYTTFGLGGPARWFVAVRSIEELVEALQWRSRHEVPLFILGGGSNLVVSDDGFEGLVIRIELSGVAFEDEGGDVRVRAAAGEAWDPFVARCVGANLAGIECLSGIPGSVGASPIQNVGAYGQEVAETIESVDVLDRTSLESRRLTAAECEFGYRYSFFKNVDPERFVVTGVTFRLRRGGAPSLGYPELERAIRETSDAAPTLAMVRDTVIAVRRKKGMVVDATDPDTRSAGSFFMNPLLTPRELEAFRARAAAVGVSGGNEKIPEFPTADGKVKTSAAWLIEQAGFNKGFQLGGVGISTRHTLALVNRGGSAGELVALKNLIQQGVKERFGIELHPEPNFVGRFLSVSG